MSDTLTDLFVEAVRRKLADDDCGCGGKTAVKYSEDQPRDDHGRFGSGGGDAPVETPTAGDSKPIGASAGDGTKGNPYMVSDPREAVRLLGAGHYVELDQPRTLSVALDKIKQIADEAKAQGRNAPTYDLCRATVTGTSMFCGESMGIQRIEMPQLAGIPRAGSWADKYLPKDAKGEVDAGPAFTAWLEATQGAKTTIGETPADVLRPSQGELQGTKVAGMMQAMQDGKMTGGTIFTSKDDYVIDGHHRWAAEVGLGFREGEKQTIGTKQIDLPITTVLNLANGFTTTIGLDHAPVNANMNEPISQADIEKILAKAMPLLIKQAIYRWSPVSEVVRRAFDGDKDAAAWLGL